MAAECDAQATKHQQYLESRMLVCACAGETHSLEQKAQHLHPSQLSHLMAVIPDLHPLKRCTPCIFSITQMPKFSTPRRQINIRTCSPAVQGTDELRTWKGVKWCVSKRIGWFLQAPIGTRQTAPAKQNVEVKGEFCSLQDAAHQRADALERKVGCGMPHYTTYERRAYSQALHHCDAGNAGGFINVTSKRGVTSHPKTSLLLSSAQEAAAHTAALKDVTG